jgi:hypothetical protein
VRDVQFFGRMTRYQSGRAGAVATGISYRGSQRSEDAIPPTGAPESLRAQRSRGPKGWRSHASAASALDREHAGLQNAGAGGMAPLLQHRAPPLTLRRVVRTVGRGGEVRVGADVARRAKGRQPAPGASRSPWWPASYGRTLRRPIVSVATARRFCMCGGQPRPGALRAPLKW